MRHSVSAAVLGVTLIVTFSLATVGCARGTTASAPDGDGSNGKRAHDGGREPDAPSRAAVDAAALSSQQPSSDEPSVGSGDDDGAVNVGALAGDDAGSLAESDAAIMADAAPPGPTPLPDVGDLAITEIMARPSASQPASEWFELTNLATDPRTLSGLTIEDGYRDVEVIAASPPIVVAPGQYAVFARSRATAIAMGVPAGAVVYEYAVGLPDEQGIELDAASLGELSLWNGSTQLAYVPYGAWAPPSAGQSLELAAPAYAGSALPGSWCFAAYPWAPGSDWGTPGQASDCQ